jgi:hypothetical protein
MANKTTSSKATQTYEAIVWIDDRPGLHLTIEAADPIEARKHLEARYGRDIFVTLYNEEDANRLR